jgi:hypothetical protein
MSTAPPAVNPEMNRTGRVGYLSAATACGAARLAATRLAASWPSNSTPHRTPFMARSLKHLHLIIVIARPDVIRGLNQAIQ